MAKAIRKSGSDNGCQTVGTVPHRHTHWLLRATVPLTCDDTEERQAASLKKTKEESGRQETVIIVTRRHARLCDAPSEQQNRHQDTMRHFNDEHGGKGLPSQLRNRRNRAQEGVLIALETGVFLQAKRGSISQY